MSAGSISRRSRCQKSRAAWVLIAAAVTWNLVALRAQTRGVPYANDSAMHAQMVRVAARLWSEGRLPLTAWYSDLGLGSPHFLHYQALPAMVTGLAGRVVGPDAAFRWSLYLLLSLWPVSVYCSARLFRIRPSAAAFTAAVSPFIVSVVGLGYEQSAYVNIGYGVWTQLWASFTLPLAWGYTWRAIDEGGARLPACALIALTTAFHFETGYLALAPLLLFTLLGKRPGHGARVRRAGTILAGTVMLSAWIIVPVIGQRAWAATNEVLHGTTMADGYPAPKLILWLVNGGLLDAGRVPVIAPFAVCGAVLGAVHWRPWRSARPLLVMLAFSLVLSTGRTTFGSLATVVPGAADIFFRRFTMGAQLALILLAGVTAGWILDEAEEMLAVLRARLGTVAVAGGGCLAVAGLLAPAWLELGHYDSANAAAITAQQRADVTKGLAVDRLISLAGKLAGGRVYAGAPTNFGRSVTVGAVPLFKYLAARDVDEIGYDLRTASLMTDPEYFFAARNPSDNVLFGVRYLLLPSRRAPPTPAMRLLSGGGVALWRTATGGYLHLGEIVGNFTADRTDIGRRSVSVERSPLAASGEFLLARLTGGTGAPSAEVARPAAIARGLPGTIARQAVDLGNGRALVNVRLRRAATVVLSASYDPGWQATVDGRPSPVIAIAPALVGLTVGAGVHSVRFFYEGYSGYSLLACVAVAGLLVMLSLDIRERHVRGRRDDGPASLAASPAAPHEAETDDVSNPSGERRASRVSATLFGAAPEL